mmetsp:Transcript_19983/g.59352  ORF Transcript_19983/g.59352 Transcript_19983/m.59352 type:complete len:211 (+) Transcript_19983:1034-1666(+)
MLFLPRAQPEVGRRGGRAAGGRVAECTVSHCADGVHEGVGDSVGCRVFSLGHALGRVRFLHLRNLGVRLFSKHLGLRGGLLRVQPSLHAGLVRQLARADARIRRLLSCSLQALLKSTEPVHGAAEQPGAPEPNGGALRVPLSDAARALTSRRARFRRTRWSRGTLGERVAPTAPLRPSELFGEVKRALSTCDGLRSAGLGVAGLSWAARA